MRNTKQLSPGQELRLSKFTRHADVCIELAQRLAAQIEQYAADTPLPHYGHIGDLAEIENTLKDLCDRMAGEGEYAPEGR